MLTHLIPTPQSLPPTVVPKVHTQLIIRNRNEQESQHEFRTKPQLITSR